MGGSNDNMPRSRGCTRSVGVWSQRALSCRHPAAGNEQQGWSVSLAAGITTLVGGRRQLTSRGCTRGTVWRVEPAGAKLVGTGIVGGGAGYPAVLDDPPSWAGLLTTLARSRVAYTRSGGA